MSKIRGGCLCGAVRYESDAEPVMVAVCHCASCQKNTGSAFSLNLGMAQDSVQIEGDSLVAYEDRNGASGKNLLSQLLLPLWFADFRAGRSLRGVGIHQSRYTR